MNVVVNWVAKVLILLKYYNAYPSYYSLVIFSVLRSPFTTRPSESSVKLSYSPQFLVFGGPREGFFFELQLSLIFGEFSNLSKSCVFAVVLLC